MFLRVVVGFCLLSCALGQPTPRTQNSQPDVFLITIDTLRADHVHCYGYDRVQTPAVDALAKDGVRFTQAFTPSPITNTSHTTILTGLLPSVHGVTDFAIPLAPNHPTWAELLKRKGYHTAAFIGAVILDSNTLAPGLDRGFDFFDNFPSHDKDKSRWGHVERRGMVVIQHAETWLGAHPTGPHFVWVHLYDPHDPYEPPPPYSQIYKDHLYDGEIAYADAALGKFIDYLKLHKWYSNSLVVVVGDHGEGLGEHNEETHGIFLYDSTLHVPLILKLPRAGETSARLQTKEKDSGAGTTIQAQVRTTDILPTVLELIGAQSPERLDGKSLTPYLAGNVTSGRAAFGETDYPLRFGWAPLRSVRDQDLKFIEAPRPEFYNLQSDKGEKKNLYEPWNPDVQKLRGMLAELRTKLPPRPSSIAAVGTGTLDELRALGYLGPADARSSTNVPEPSLLPDPKDKIEEQNLLHTAMMASEDNRPAEARTALEKVLQSNPKSSTALLQLGELELQSGQDAKAAEYLKRATELRPNDATAAYYQGEALAKTGDLAGARDALETSLKLLPGQFPARLLLGEVYLRLKNPQAAADQFEAALLLQPKNVAAELDAAKASLETDPEEAVRKLESFTRLHPQSAEGFALLAEAYEKAGRNEAAQRAANRAKALESKRPKPGGAT